MNDYTREDILKQMSDLLKDQPEESGAHIVNVELKKPLDQISDYLKAIAIGVRYLVEKAP